MLPFGLQTTVNHKGGEGTGRCTRGARKRCGKNKYVTTGGPWHHKWNSFNACFRHTNFPSWNSGDTSHLEIVWGTWIAYSRDASVKILSSGLNDSHTSTLLAIWQKSEDWLSHCKRQRGVQTTLQMKTTTKYNSLPRGFKDLSNTEIGIREF